MSFGYRRLPVHSESEDETLDTVQPVRRRSEPALEFDELSDCFGYRRASLPVEYSKLHGLLQRLSNRRRARSERNSSSSGRQEESDSSPHKSETSGGASETEREEEVVEFSRERQTSTKRTGESFKYRKLRHTELYRTHSDALFPGPSDLQNPAVLVQ